MDIYEERIVYLGLKWSATASHTHTEGFVAVFDVNVGCFEAIWLVKVRII